MNINNITGFITQGGDTWSVAQVAAHLANTTNPHSVTAAQVGLGNTPDYGIFSGTLTMVGVDGVTDKLMTPDQIRDVILDGTGGSISGGDGIDYTGGVISADLSTASDVNLEIRTGKLALKNVLQSSSGADVLDLDNMVFGDSNSPTVYVDVSGPTLKLSSFDGTGASELVWDAASNLFYGAGTSGTLIIAQDSSGVGGSSPYVDLGAGAATLDAGDGTGVYADSAGDLVNLNSANSTMASVDGSGFALQTGAAVTGINDTDAMSDASATTLATSESIKAYVDSSTAITGGDGLTLSGLDLSVNVGEGIFIEADTVKLADSVGGAGLAATDGVIAVGQGTNIAVSGTDVALATNVDVAGTLDVTGATTLDSTLTSAGLVTASAGLTVADGQTLTLNTVGLDTVSTANTGSGLDNGTIWTAQATKEYIDNVAQGLDAKDAVDVVTVSGDGNITLSGEQTIDGVLTSASRVLLTEQTDATENGIYVTAAGAWSRATDMAQTGEFRGAYIPVGEAGTSNKQTLWLNTNTTDVTVGTTAVTFTQINGASNVTAGAGLTKTGNQLDAKVGNGIEVSADTIGIANDGVTTVRILDLNVTTDKLAADAVTTAKIASNAVTATEISLFHDASNAADTKIPIGDGVTYVEYALSGDVTMTNAGVVTISADAVEPSMINVLDDALAATDTHILIADGTDYSSFALSGDVTMTNAGVVTLGADVVDGTNIADNSIDSDHYVDGSIDTIHIGDDQVSGAKLAPAVAGTGIVQDGSGNLDVDFASATETKTGTSAVKAVSPSVMHLYKGSAGTDSLRLRPRGTVDATGDYALALGVDSTASGNNSLAFAYESTASAQDAVAVGKGSTASGLRGVSVGSTATASGDDSVSLIGTSSGAGSIAAGASATATNSQAVAVGDSASATQPRAVSLGSGSQATAADTVAAGVQVIASGVEACAYGYGTQASGVRATALGAKGHAINYGEISFGGGDSFSAQESKFQFVGQTTNATLTELFLCSQSSERAVLSNDTVWTYKATINAVNASDETERMTYIVWGTCERGANAAATVVDSTTQTTILRDDAPSWDFAISADTTNGSLKFEGQGAAATNVNWHVKIEMDMIGLT